MLNTDIDIDMDMDTSICDLYAIDLDELDNVYNEYNVLYEQELNYNNTYIFYYMFSIFMYSCILASSFTEYQKNNYIYLYFLKNRENRENRDYIDYIDHSININNNLYSLE